MDLDQLRAFVTVVDRGSLLHAAAEVGCSRATLRGRVDALEQALGLQLLVRTKKGARATEVGEAFYGRARALLRQADELAHFAEGQRGEVEGELRVRLPIALPAAMNARFVAATLERHPKLRLRMDVSNEAGADSLEGYDLVVTFADVLPAGPYRTFVLARAPQRLVASPVYLEARGTPRCTADLAEHTLLAWDAPDRSATSWPLRDGGELAVEPSVITADVIMLRLLAGAGQGIALLPQAALGRDLAPGGPVEVLLPDEVGHDTVLRALLPETTSASPRSRAAVELARALSRGVFGVSFVSL